jgi:hypothetical protein
MMKRRKRTLSENRSSLDFSVRARQAFTSQKVILPPISPGLGESGLRGRGSPVIEKRVRVMPGRIRAEDLVWSLLVNHQ